LLILKDIFMNDHTANNFNEIIMDI
jgi:hypothetical protein